MNAVLRHITVRLWLTGLAGGLVCLVLLPGWERVFGLHWLILPAAVILAASFAAAGWGMNRLGIALARRQVKEATAWERAGMIHEADTGFHLAASFFDSFWLSPFFRRGKMPWLYGTLARFHLSQFPGTPHTRFLAAGYLKSCPQDRIVAEIWLEGLVSLDPHLNLEHEAAARVAAVLGDHQRIRQLLMHFFLAGGRIDFDAQLIYRQAWKEGQFLESRQVHELARLLLHESIINPWSFQVYLNACRTGMADALAGVAAGLNLVPVGEQGRRDLAAARQLVAGQDAEKIQRLGAGFKLTQLESVHDAPGAGGRRWKSAAPGIAKSTETILAAVSNGLRDGSAWGRGKLAGLKPRHVLYGLGLSGVVALALLIIPTGRPPREPAPSPEPQTGTRMAIENEPVITDPFTIQVAAYLNARDAQRIVDQLTGQKLDAFWTKATGANRTWYQVKVSHFPTREAAQGFGLELKARGLIDDFFVANYRSDKSKTTLKNP